MAQGKLKGDNLQGYENRKIRWGFSLGLNTSWYQVEHSKNYVDQLGEDASSGYSANAKEGIGFNVNFIATYRLTPDFVVRLQPGVGYHSRSIEYKGNLTGAGDETVMQTVNSFSGELPVLVKYEANRRKNTQMYFIAGVKPSIVVGGQKKNDPEVLQVGTSDFSIEFGVGLDMFYPFFKFAPELRFSRGISNLHQPFNSVYNNTFQQLTTNTVTLYLNFE
ncbi:MAG: porin family protein [Rufibacter sp.]